MSWKSSRSKNCSLEKGQIRQVRHGPIGEREKTRCEAEKGNRKASYLGGTPARTQDHPTDPEVEDSDQIMGSTFFCVGSLKIVETASSYLAGHFKGD